MESIRVGIIGCGEVTQIMHLPSLFQLNPLFEVTAICDVSQQVLAGVGNQWGIPQRYTDYRQMVVSDDVDAVLVASPHAHHTQNVLAALAAGKHVLVEKPLCFTLEESHEIIAAQQRAGVIVQVGYMRRYLPAFEQACQIVQAMPAIKLARVHDVIGRNALIIEGTSRVIRGNDIAPQIIEEGKKLQKDVLEQTLGPVSAELESTYLMLLGLVSHDISAMREILGMPSSVLYAAQRHQGRYISAALDYEDFVCHLEIGVDNIPRFDGSIQVYGADKVVEVRYSTPYVRNLPQHLHITEVDAAGRTVDSMIHPAWGDPFVAEWQDFHRNVSQQRTPKTSPQDYHNDLLIFQQMMDLMKQPTVAIN